MEGAPLALDRQASEASSGFFDHDIGMAAVTAPTPKPNMVNGT